MSDEQKIEEELESDDDVAAHGKVGTHTANDEGSTDDDGDVEAHVKLKGGT